MLYNKKIKDTIGHCLDCPPGSPAKALIAGRCRTHYWHSRAGKNTTKKTTANYYNYWLENSGVECEECGTSLSKFNLDQFIGAQAHIVPKELFPSVAEEMENHMTLGAGECACHSRYDKSWEAAQQMSVWPVAVERFKKFCHRIAPQEVRKLTPALREVYDLCVLNSSAI